MLLCQIPYVSQVEIRLSLTGKVAITCRASLCTRSNSRKPWDKIRIDYLISTQECGERLRKVLVGVGVGALHAVDEQHVIVPKKIMTVVSSNNNNKVGDGEREEEVPLPSSTFRKMEKKTSYLYC